MNPLPMVVADLRALRWTAAAIVALVAIVIAIGVAVGAQERALRKGSTSAANDFDLLIGAPGSQSQLVLSTIFLQPDAIPLAPGAILNRLAADSRVAAVAPIAFGDVSNGYPVVGSTAAFASRWGRLAPMEGRMFQAEGEAVIGADVALALGASIVPSHATVGFPTRVGVASEEEAAHRHEGHAYRVVGRMPRLGSPWDRAIIVPIESVWETHGLGAGHRAEGAPLGPPFDAEIVPGVPAIVVKPKSVADAYALRGQYRSGGAMAFFPAEVLVTLYGALGDIRDALVVASTLNTILIFVAVLLVLVAVTGLRRRRYAILRALGAPRRYILGVIWLGAASMIAAGCALGLFAGWLLTLLLSDLIERRMGLRLSFSFNMEDLFLVAALLAIGSLMAILPALLAYRHSVAAGLRE